MKALLTLAVTVVVFGQVYANDTIPILNTVFHGINTFLNITRPTPVVVTQPAVVPPPPVVVTQPTVVTPVVPVPPPKIYYINGQAMIIQNGVYVPYVVPYGHRYRKPPPPPKHHNRHPPPPPGRGKGRENRR